MMESTRKMRMAATAMRLRAHMLAPYDGRSTPANALLMQQCRTLFLHEAVRLVASLIFTRDEGMHSNGWWRNPDYARCEHLSLSFVDFETRELAPHDHERAHAWMHALWPETYRLVWIEPPYSEHGHGTHHYRVFYAEDWKTPLLPRGEVYSRELTEAGWKSFSEVYAGREHGVAVGGEHGE